VQSQGKGCIGTMLGLQVLDSEFRRHRFMGVIVIIMVHAKCCFFVVVVVGVWRCFAVVVVVGNGTATTSQSQVLLR